MDEIIYHRIKYEKLRFRAYYTNNMIIFKQLYNSRYKNYIIINLTSDDMGFIQVSIDSNLISKIKSNDLIEIYDAGYNEGANNTYYYALNISHNLIIRNLVEEYKENIDNNISNDIMESLLEIAVRMCSNF
jgi:hypothetical protein